MNRIAQMYLLMERLGSALNTSFYSNTDYCCLIFINKKLPDIYQALVDLLFKLYLAFYHIYLLFSFNLLGHFCTRTTFFHYVLVLTGFILFIPIVLKDTPLNSFRYYLHMDFDAPESVTSLCSEVKMSFTPRVGLQGIFRDQGVFCAIRSLSAPHFDVSFLGPACICGCSCECSFVAHNIHCSPGWTNLLST